MACNFGFKSHDSFFMLKASHFCEELMQFVLVADVFTIKYSFYSKTFCCLSELS